MSGPGCGEQGRGMKDLEMRTRRRASWALGTSEEGKADFIHSEHLRVRQY